MRYLQNFQSKSKLDEELIYNPDFAKPSSTETPDFSNRLFYWNNLTKKFKQGKLTEQEKVDYKNFCNARTWWLMMDLEDSLIDEKKKREYQKRFKDFEEALDRAYKKIPDDFFERNKLKEVRSKLNVRSVTRAPKITNLRFKPMKNEKLSFKSVISNPKGVKEVSEVLQKYNDWLETIDIPWNEISSYLNVIRRVEETEKESPSYETGEIPKIVGTTLNKIADLIDYSFEMMDPDTFKMSKSEYEEAKSPFGRAKNDAETLIQSIEDYLYDDFYSPRKGEKYRQLIEDKIRETERAIKTKDTKSILNLCEELKKLRDEADFRFGKSDIEYSLSPAQLAQKKRGKELRLEKDRAFVKKLSEILKK